MSRPTFLSAQWKHLVLLNYKIRPEVLLPFLPAGTELDFYEGHTYVSLVAFVFHKTTVTRWIPAFFHRDFEEVNLRFYVTRKDKTGVKRGVVFIKEIVPKAFLAWTARQFYSENYVSMPMSNRIEVGKSYQYSWGADSVQVTAKTQLISAPEHSLERWITEHYWGYTRVTETKTYEYEVKHPVWNLYEIESHRLKLDVGPLYGAEFVPTFESPPSSMFVADGSAVTVHWPSSFDTP